MPRESNRNQVESVETALRLLLLFDRYSEIRVTDAAKELGVSASTAHRILSTFMSQRFVTQDRVTRRYRLGPVLIELGVRGTRSFDLRGAAEPHLKALAGRLGETVNLLVMEGSSVRFVSGFEGDQGERTQVLTGTLLPAYATSGGKLMLAEMPQSAIRKLYPDGLRRLTYLTKTFRDLVDELELITIRGYATNEGESILGLSALAVPLRDPGGRLIATVAMSAPTTRFRALELREIIVQLRECATQIRAGLRT